jgi:riboflavin biosynthesis pyrimidine reductase
VFRGEAPALVVTTPAGAARLGAESAAIATAVVDADGFVPLPLVLSAAGLGAGSLVLVESGPRSTTRYVAEGAIDELFLTRAPFLIGNGGATRALGLVEGGGFAPGTRPARLVSARRFASFLYLRYAL